MNVCTGENEQAIKKIIYRCGSSIFHERRVNIFQLLNISGIVPQATVTAEFPMDQICLNLQDFSSAYRFASWTPKVTRTKFQRLSS